MIRVKKEGRLLIDVLSKIGVFSVFLLLSFFSVVIYSPVLKSDADSTATTEIGADVKPVASVSVYWSSNNFTISPTASGSTGSDYNYIDVTINSNGGYEMYISSVDEDTDMVSQDSDSVIKSDFEGIKSGTYSMPKDNWGWSINDSSHFQKVTKASEPVLAKSIDYYPMNGKDRTKLYTGANISTKTTSGVYSKDLLITVLVHAANPDVVEPKTLQEFECLDSYMIGRPFTLEDTRTSKTYKVQKLSSGKCWMLSELWIDNVELTSEDTDIDGTFTLPALNWDESHDYSAKQNNPYLSKVSNPGGNTHYYYNYAAATAGTVSGSSNTSEPTGSICPKGWRMPTFNEYIGAYWNSGNNIYNSYIYGYGILKYNEDSLSEHSNWSSFSSGDKGGAWTSDVMSNSADPNGILRMSYVYANYSKPTSSTSPRYTDRANGVQVYCVARDVIVEN
jgi:hypothetical protein